MMKVEVSEDFARLLHCYRAQEIVINPLTNEAVLIGSTVTVSHEMYEIMPKGERERYVNETLRRGLDVEIEMMHDAAEAYDAAEACEKRHLAWCSSLQGFHYPCNCKGGW